MIGARRKWAVAAVAGLGCATVEFSFSGAAFANDAVIQALGTDSHRIGWAFGPYLVLLIVWVVVAARLQRAFGSRVPFVVSMLMLGVASAIAAAAQSLEALIVARLIMSAKGVGVAVALSQLWLVFPRRKGFAMALYAASMYGALPLGLAIGAFVAFDPSWRSAYVACSVAAFMCAAVGWYAMVPDWPATPSTARWDVAGIALLTLWLGAAVFLLMAGRYFSWTASALVCGAFGVLVVGLSGFLWRELAAAEPLIQLRLRPARTLGLTLVALGLFGAVMIGLVQGLPSYFNLRGYQGADVGWTVLPAGVVYVATTLGAGIVSRPVSMVWTLRIAFAIQLVALAMLQRLDLYTSRASTAAILMLWAVGAGLVLPPGLRLTFAGQPPQTVQQLASVKIALRFFATVLGSLVALVLAAEATDGAFDDLRQRITWTRPAPAQVEARLHAHALSRGNHAAAARRQSKAIVAGWVGVNARAIGHVAGLRYLLLVGGAGLVVTILIRPPQDQGILAGDDVSLPWPRPT